MIDPVPSNNTLQARRPRASRSAQLTGVSAGVAISVFLLVVGLAGCVMPGPPATAPVNSGPVETLTAEPNHGRQGGTCNPGFPSGFRGRFRTSVDVVFAYAPTGDTQFMGRQDKEIIERTLSDLASARPSGPQFEFVASNTSPADLYLVLMYSGRGTNEQNEIHWGFVAGQAAGQAGHLFQFNTEEHQASETALWSWSDEVKEEAAERWYGFIANGWTC